MVASSLPINSMNGGSDVRNTLTEKARSG
jgi:hypothetical protein